MTSGTCTQLCLAEFYKFSSSTTYFTLFMRLDLTMHYFCRDFWNWLIRTLSCSPQLVAVMAAGRQLMGQAQVGLAGFVELIVHFN